MISRGKNLVYLARSGKSNVPLNEVKLDESDEHSDEYNYDYLEDQYAEDPWSHFKKWQAAKKIKIPLAQRLNNSYCNQKDNHMENDNQNFEERVLEELRPLETSPQLSTLDHNLQGNVQTESENSVNSVLNDIQNHEDPVNQLTPLTTTEAVHTCNDQLLNSAEKEDHNSDDENSHLSESSLFADSSVSWKPNQENDVTSEDNYSEISESIPRKSPIYFQTASKERQSSNPVKCIESSLDAKNPLPTSPKPLPTSDCDLSGSTRRPIHKNPVEHSLRKGRVWDKKDRCSYCDKDVTNFSRHLFRKHAEEESVRKILEQPKGERKRKIMIDLIRKQGNFTVLGENITRPVQRPSAIQSKNDEILPTDYLPCIYCKGLYKKKSLRRHALTCCYNKEMNQKHNFASEGQTMIAFTESRQEFLKKSRLKCEVFSKMRADRISLNGKSDPIICQYAEDYLRKHKRPHIKNAVSNKVRELGRLLIPLQDIYKINSMLEVLKPEHFDKVVSASRIISGYNEAKRSFKAPSLALHMKTILLAVCSSAKTLMLKKHPILGITDYDIALKNVKGFRELVDANWKFEMSSLALKDLNEKQSINPQKLPVTQDIILFRNYTQEIAETCVKELETNSENLTSFKKLTEAALALTIILNRKRIGDVQYTQLESYNRISTSTNQEECLSSLNECERELSKHFKRITTVGKGSRSVPILFSKNVQKYIETLLSVRRKTTFVPHENPFLFALTGSSTKWVDGSAVLRRYAVKCGAKNPGTLTSSRLRKQIATVLQILNLNDTEMEQVATFMGHTKKTHEQFYRMPQDVFQTAKIAKLLLMMERGVGSQNQGKTLDEINVELESWNGKSLEDPGSESEDHDLEEKSAHDEPKEEDERIRLDMPTMSVTSVNVTQTNKHKAQTMSDDSPLKKKKISKEKPKKEKCRGTWNDKQKSIMLNYFKNHIKNKISPKKAECLKLQQDNLDSFMNKTWVQIKVFVYNTYKNK